MTSLSTESSLVSSRTVTSQVRHLARQASHGLIWSCSALLLLDLFFIAIFSSHWISSALDQNAVRLSSHWHLGKDGSYSELLGYLKLAVIVAAMALISMRRRRPVYSALALLFAVALLDDAMQLHERMGAALAGTLALQSSTLGELLAWMIFGVFLSIVVRAGFVRSPQHEDRRNAILLLGAFGVLLVFAVVADVAHVVVLHEFRYRTVDALLTVMEDGGEQITLTLIFALAVLINRDVRTRDLVPSTGTAHRVKSLP
ncbi:MAG TPA: hypothetical protein VHH32_07750 [Gemmatimonadales bacterium]|nr:hypothetical protein [Gemmatimonadales bacterium]